VAARSYWISILAKFATDSQFAMRIYCRRQAQVSEEVQIVAMMKRTRGAIDGLSPEKDVTWTM
jgi:hypothetical protein